MKIILNNDIDNNEWESFLANHPMANPFSTPSYFKLYNTNPNELAEAISIFEGNKMKAIALVTLLKEPRIKGYFSRRAIIYGGILFDEKKHLEKILDIIDLRFKSKSIYIEIRNFFNYNDFKETYADNGWHYLDYLDVIIPLQKFKTTDAYIASLKYNRRREIKQSLENNAIFREAHTPKDITDLYQILKDLYKNKVKLPIPTLQFFMDANLSKIGKTIVVEHHNKIIGGAFLLYQPLKNIYTLYYCGIQNYHNKIFPTHLAILGTVDFSIKNNIPYIDLMGAGRKNEEYGVRKYKLNFGGEITEFGRFRKINQPLLFKLGEKAIAFKKYLT